MSDRRCIRLIAIAVLALVAVVGAPVRNHGVTRAAADCLSADEAVLLDRINTYRVLNDLPALAASPTLTRAARHHALSMAEFNYFPEDYSVRHEGPNADETISWQQNIANAGYPDNTHTVRGAIIGAGTNSPATIFRTLTELPAYEAVLADPRFAAIGIGFAANPASEEGGYWAITFGSVSDGEVGPCSGVAVHLPILAGGRSSNATESNLAFDGDLGTAWATTGDAAPRNAYIWFDLGTVHAISSIEWLMSRPGAADSFAIDVSDDGETWDQIARKGNGAVNEWRSVSWAGEVRFVRFYFSNPNDDPVLGYLAEVRIFQ